MAHNKASPTSPLWVHPGMSAGFIEKNGEPIWTASKSPLVMLAAGAVSTAKLTAKIKAGANQRNDILGCAVNNLRIITYINRRVNYTEYTYNGVAMQPPRHSMCYLLKKSRSTDSVWSGSSINGKCPLDSSITNCAWGA
jgi:hypothetical protein